MNLTEKMWGKIRVLRYKLIYGIRGKGMLVNKEPY